jgi:hypothetical protein
LKNKANQGQPLIFTEIICLYVCVEITFSLGLKFNERKKKFPKEKTLEGSSPHPKGKEIMNY